MSYGFFIGGFVIGFFTGIGAALIYLRRKMRTQIGQIEDHLDQMDEMMDDTDEMLPDDMDQRDS